MDAYESTPLFDTSNAKPLNFLSGLSSAIPWPVSISAPPTPASRTAPLFRNAVTYVSDTIHSPWVIGGALALGAIAAGASWFYHHTVDVSQSQIARVEAENQRLFQEIDRLSRDNEMLLEGSHRAVQLNQEVRKFT